MKFLYGLVLLFFEGFVSQCRSEEASTSINLKNLPSEIYQEILSRVGPNATEQAEKDGQISLSAAKRIFEDYIFQINPTNSNGDSKQIDRYVSDGMNYITLWGSDMILTFFNNFGHLVKKININYVSLSKENVIRRRINDEVIKKYAREFTVFNIYIYISFSAFLDELSNEGVRIHFPKVKQLGYDGPDCGNSFHFHSIFPSLESLHLSHYSNAKSFSAMRINMTCMENVTKLKELILDITPESYKLPELEHILKKNMQLSTLGLVLNDKIDILRWVEKHLKNLEVLEISFHYTKFLDHVSEKHPFNMTKLKTLKIDGTSKNPRIMNFVNSFRKLETLYVLFPSDLILSKINNLIEIKEIIISTSGEKLTNLEEILDSFGRKEGLNKIEFGPIPEYEYKTYESRVMKINEKFEQLHKPTWVVKYMNTTKKENIITNYMWLLPKK